MMSPIADFFLLSKEQILQKAEKLRSEGKHSKAAEFIASGLKNNAEDYELLIALASAHLADKKGRDAVMALKNAVTLVPARSNEIMEMAERFYYSEGQLPEMGDLAFEMNLGKRNFDSAIKVTRALGNRDVEIMHTRYKKLKESQDHYQGPPKPAGVVAREMTTYYGVAILTERKGQISQALDILESIMSRSQNEAENIIAVASMLSSFHPGDNDTLARHGDILMGLGKKERALELYNEAAKSGGGPSIITKLEDAAVNDPKSVEIMTMLARLYIQNSDPAKAFDMVSKLLTVDRLHHDSWINMLREIIKLDPRMASAHMLLGDAALESEKLDLAMAGYSQVAELEPDRLEEVLGRYRKVMEKSPGNFEAATKIIDAYISAKQTGKAIAAIREIIAKDVTLIDLALEKLDAILKSNLDQPEALSFLGECYLIRQDRPKAVSVYKYLAGLGSEQTQAALAGLKNAAEQDLSDPLTLLARLEVLIKAGMFKDAAICGMELARKHSTEWADYLPLLEQGSQSDDPDFNNVLADICDQLERAGQSHPAVDFVKSEALARIGRFEESAGLLIKLSRQADTAELADNTLKELAGKYPKGAHLQLALAEQYQEKGKLDEMASALLMAIRYEQTMVRTVTEKLNLLLEKNPENVKLQMLQLELLFQEKLYDKAFQKAGQIISRWPDATSARAHLRIGQIHLERGELTKAAGSLMKSSELDAGVSPEAAESLKRLLELDVTSLAGHYAMAKVLINQRSFDQAIDELMLVAERDPRLSANVAGDLKNIEKIEPTNAKALMAQAQINFSLNKADEAALALNQVMDIAPANFAFVEKLYRKMLEANPKNFRIYLSLARAYIISGDIDQAGRLIESTINVDPNLYEQAISLLRISLEKEPGNLSNQILLARIYRQRANYEQSLALLRNSVTGDDSLVPAIIKELQQIVSAKPELLEARYLLAGMYCRQNQPEAEVREYQAIYKADGREKSKLLEKLGEILKTDPKMLLAVILSSRILADQGRYSDAVTGYMRACELDNAFRPTAVTEIEKMVPANPKLPEIYEALGTIYFDQGRFPQAKDMLTQASTLLTDPDRKMKALFYLAESHLALRDETRADQAMDQVRAMMSNANEVYKALRRFASRHLQVEIDKAYQALNEAPDDQSRKLELAGKLILVQKYDASINLLNFKPLDEDLANRRLLVLARAFFGRNEAVTAMELLRLIPLDNHPYNRFQMEIGYLLGQCYEAIGNYTGAVATYRNIYMDQTDFKDVKARLAWCSERAVMKDLEHRGTLLEMGV